jgi:hypothetical protein
MAYEGMSEYAAKKVLDHLTGKASWTMPTDVYVALYDGDPLNAGSELADPPDTDYARVAMADTDWNSAAFASPTASIDNATDVDFGTAGSAWGTVDHVAIFDALTGGNMLYSGPLEVSRSVQLNDPVKFPAGELILRITQATV